MKEIFGNYIEANFSRSNILPYFAFHVRRGDKKGEQSLIPIWKYVSALEELMKNNSAELGSSEVLRGLSERPVVYLASDDMQNVHKELKTFRPAWDIRYRNGSIHSHGHSQSDFNMLSGSLRENRAIDILIELEILKRAKFVVCTFSSNVCSLVQILRTADPKTMQSVDMDWLKGMSFYISLMSPLWFLSLPLIEIMLSCPDPLLYFLIVILCYLSNSFSIPCSILLENSKPK